MNDSIKSVVVLTAICLIVTTLLAGVNFYTAPMIAEATEAAKQASLREVLPQAGEFEELTLPETTPETVTGIYKDSDGSGYAITIATSSQYSDSDMLFTVGVDTEGKILNIVLTNYAESKDFGADYPQNFVGADKMGAAAVDTVGGVTYSSTAFKNAVADAFTALEAVKEGA